MLKVIMHMECKGDGIGLVGDGFGTEYEGLDEVDGDGSGYIGFRGGAELGGDRRYDGFGGFYGGGEARGGVAAPPAARSEL